MIDNTHTCWLIVANAQTVMILKRWVIITLRNHWITGKIRFMTSPSFLPLQHLLTMNTYEMIIIIMNNWISEDGN